MARIFITTLDEAESAALPDSGDVAAVGAVQTRRVVGTPDRPIKLWLHRLAPGATLRWTKARVGRMVYLWEGSMTADGKPLAGEGATVIEHGASCEIHAGDDGCALLEFHRVVEETQRAGGCVHSFGRDEAPFGVVGSGGLGIRLYADSDCPTCELWLHESQHAGAGATDRHYHTQDEIIVCTGGTMNLGARTLNRGGVLAVDKDALYSFSIPETGGGFINFRGGPSEYVQVDKAGKHAPMDEVGFLRKLVKGSAPVWVVSEVEATA